MAKPMSFRFILDPHLHADILKNLMEDGKVGRAKSRLFLCWIELYAKHLCQPEVLHDFPEHLSKSKGDMDDFKLKLMKDAYPTIYNLIDSQPFGLKSVVATNLVLKTAQVLDENPMLIPALMVEAEKKEKEGRDTAIREDVSSNEAEDISSLEVNDERPESPPLMDVSYIEGDSEEALSDQAAEILEDLAGDFLDLY